MKRPEQQYQPTLPGTLVSIAGQGVLLSGPPGIGKSETALDLVTRGHSLVADDLVKLVSDRHGMLRGRVAADGMNGYIEVRGIGLLKVDALYGGQSYLSEARILLEIGLLPPRADSTPDLDRLRGIAGRRTVNGCQFPVVKLWASPGRPLATLIEAITYRLISEQAGKDDIERFYSMQRKLLDQVSQS